MDLGRLIDGRWVNADEARGLREDDDGRFRREESSFRDRVSADPDAKHPAAKRRYHLFVSYACPWASRTLAVRKLKRLDELIGVTVVDPHLGEGGWRFSDEDPDPILGAEYLHETYQAADDGYTGRVTVPVLWDRERRTIVNNESAEIIRFLNTAFDEVGADASVDLFPEPLQAEIDDVNARVYETVNNGVYRCGFARSQEAYDEAVDELFTTLDWLEDRLGQQRWLVGDQLTEADVRLFVTAVRFDPVYVTHFKCNHKRLADYPNLLGHTRDVFQTDGVADTVNLDHIRRHYYGSHRKLNPYGIVPAGFDVDLDAPHGRGG